MHARASLETRETRGEIWWCCNSEFESNLKPNQAASTEQIMPPVDLAKFSADPVPWVCVPGWILNVAAVSGNTLVIYLITTNRGLQTHENLFIMSLAIADFCFSVYFAFASLTNLCVMTVDRYVAIVMPFKYVSIMTSRCIVTMVILSWLFPAVFFL